MVIRTTYSKAPMTDKQKMFADAYLANGYCATKAYRTAYPNAGESTVQSMAWATLKKPAVKEYIDARRKEIYDALCIDAEHIAQELATMAFAEKGDEEYTAQIKVKALDLLQKQLGIQNKNVKVDADVVNKVQIVEDYGEDDEDQPS